MHDNLGALAPVTVTNSFATDTLGNLAQTSGQVIANSTSTSGATAVLRPGGTVTLSAWVSSLPTNPVTTLGTPIFALSKVASNNLSLGSTSGAGTGPGNPLTVTVTASTSADIGAYPVNFSVESTLISGGTTTNAYNNYTFTVFVGSNTAGNGAAPIIKSYPNPPNRGVLNVYELAPGGSVSEDPAIDYETVGYEPILNVYQALVSYNGSSAGPAASDFVPNLATCVPGSTQCTALYGNSMVDKNGNYTFVINPSAQFYNPITGAHYPVYPSDVLFSLARTCLFSTYPGYQVNPGWILCQSLLPNANVAKQIYKTNPALAPNPYEKFAGTHDAETRTNFVAELRLDLIPGDGKLTVRAKFATGEIGDDLFVRGAETVGAIVTIAETEEFRAVFVPASRLLPEFGRLDRGHEKFLGAASVHLFADHPLDAPEGPQSQRKPGVESLGERPNETGAQHQPMADELRFGGCLLEREETEIAGAHAGKNLDEWGRNAGAL